MLLKKLYIIQLLTQQEMYVPLKLRLSKSADLTRRSVGDAAAGLSLHFLHMSEGPFWHDAGQINTDFLTYFWWS